MNNTPDTNQSEFYPTPQFLPADETINAAIATINDMSTYIASAAEEQNTVADEINKNINQISQIAERSSEDAKKTEIASTELSSLSEELSTLRIQFKI